MDRPPDLVPEALRDRLRSVRNVLVLSGAGMSAESGVPTFRGPDGLWKGFDPAELASPQGFARHPLKVWEWYLWRLGRVREADPNAGHLAIAKLANRIAVSVVTQNVDGLHQRAGSADVVEIHGSILRTRCSRPWCEHGQGDMPREDPAGFVARATGVADLPRCSCGAPLRPAVVWFGESLPEQALIEAGQAVNRCDLALVVGTSGMVYPAAALPSVVLDRGAEVIEVNPESTPLSDLATWSLRGSAGDVIPRLTELIGVD